MQTINFDAPPLNGVIEILLLDMNTGRNILLNGRELTKKFLPKIKPRAQKSDDEKFFRTRKNAEVFTPSRVVKFMVDALDDGQIDSRWLEVACGEAPFITNDARAGIIDRKLRRAKNFPDVKRALQSVYGYELQGDSLLIARANVLLAVADCLENISDSELAECAEIIAWNFFQLDGTEDSGLFGTEIIDWLAGRKFIFGGNTMKKFDFVIGNPPYQDETTGDNKTFAPPVYDKIMKAAHKVGKKVELITPARFLFDAGATSKDFNQRILSDSHFKVLDYQPDARKVFKNVDIKGGVAITLRDEDKNFGAIEIFIPFPELKTVHQKVCVDNKNFKPLSEIMTGTDIYHWREQIHIENPTIAKRMSKGHEYDISTNAFELLPEIFFDDKPNDGREYVQMIGREKNQRKTKWLRRDYLKEHETFYKWEALVPASNGSGALGEVIPTPLVGHTSTFITVGAFDSEAEARACLSYIKSKFCRAMLGILKVTQHNPPATWAKVPLQDFTPAGDIDWSGDVDAQLYKKYELDAAEIKFIETHVKAM